MVKDNFFKKMSRKRKSDLIELLRPFLEISKTELYLYKIDVFGNRTNRTLNFIITKEWAEYAIGRTLYYDEFFGRYSDLKMVLEKSHFENGILLTTNQIETTHDDDLLTFLSDTDGDFTGQPYEYIFNYHEYGNKFCGRSAECLSYIIDFDNNKDE
jgi:hypothetical protein